MPEQFNKQQIREINQPENKMPAGLEIEKSPALENVADQASAIKQSLDKDYPINISQLVELKKSLNEITVDVGGLKIPIRDISGIPDLKETTEIWSQILDNGPAGVEYWKMKYLNLPTAKALVEYKPPHLDLLDLVYLSSEVAEELAKYEGKILLIGTQSRIVMDEKLAEILSHHQGDLQLSKIKDISPSALELLMHHSGQNILLGLLTLTNEQATAMAKGAAVGKARTISLPKLVVISDKALYELADIPDCLNRLEFNNETLDGRLRTAYLQRHTKN